MANLVIYFSICNYSVDIILLIIIFYNLAILSFGGGIGRRAGFKIQFFRECGFDSHPKYFFLIKNICNFVPSLEEKFD